MFEWFLKFRESNYWYIFLIFLLTFLMFFLQKVRGKSPHKYKRYIKILVLVPSAFLALSYIAFLIMVIYTGFSKDWLENYTTLLLIIGPIIIFTLIVYALRKEKCQKALLKKTKGQILPLDKG